MKFKCVCGQWLTGYVESGAEKCGKCNRIWSFKYGMFDIEYAYHIENSWKVFYRKDKSDW